MIGPAKIVVRYASGKTLKGYSQDFSPASPHFHVRPNEAAGAGTGQQVLLRDLKAIFSSEISQEIILTRSGRRLWPGRPSPGRKSK